MLQMNDTILRMHNITAKTQHWHIRKSKIQPQTIWQKFIKVESNKTTASLLGFFYCFNIKHIWMIKWTTADQIQLWYQSYAGS